MHELKSIIDLEERLKELGYDFPNYKTYMKWLKTEWDKISSPRVDKLLETTPDENRFPTLSVELDGTQYKLHGIVHGSPVYATPGWHPRRNIRNYVSEIVDSFHKPMEGEDYLYEQNMSMNFDFLKSKELEDHINTNGDSESILKIVGKGSACFLASIFLPCVPIVFSGLYLYSITIKNPKEKVKRLLYLGQKALSDEKYQALFADFYMAQEMPQPYNLEKEYLLNKDSFIDKLFNYLMLKPDLATPQERSLWTAKELRNYAKRKDLKILHYIGGTAHMTEIAYFLQNPDFSFERLEEYRMSRR